MPSPRPPTSRQTGGVLLATTRAALREQVAHLAGAAHAELDVTGEPAHLRRAWPSASLVVVGCDMRAGLPVAPARRGGVVVVAEPQESEPGYRYAVALGATDVVLLPGDGERLVELLADSVDSRDAAPVVGVMGASGGIGASVLAAGVALTAARAGLACALVDADALGNDLDVLTDTRGEPGLRWPDLRDARGRLPPDALRAALPFRGGVGVLSGPPDVEGPVPAAAVDAVLPALSRGHDLVVVDLPRVLDPAGEAALPRCTHVLVVAGADDRGAAAGRRVVHRLAGRVGDLGLVVRRLPQPSADPPDLADHLGLPLVATVRHDPRVAPDSSGLRLRPSLRGACRQVLAAVAP
jgi:secretion/DNA translocation related CpaE-like protein